MLVVGVVVAAVRGCVCGNDINLARQIRVISLLLQHSIVWYAFGRRNFYFQSHLGILLVTHSFSFILLHLFFRPLSSLLEHSFLGDTIITYFFPSPSGFWCFLTNERCTALSKALIFCYFFFIFMKEWKLGLERGFYGFRQLESW